MFNLAEVTSYTTTSVSSDSSGGGAAIILMLIYLAIGIVGVVAFWKVFVKAGHPGWAAIIPIYNIYILLKIAGRPGWWILLYFIPFVSLIASALVSIDVAKNFGKTPAFGVIGLWLFSLIGYLILGFGDATYTPGTPGGSAPSAVAPTV